MKRHAKNENNMILGGNPKIGKRSTARYSVTPIEFIEIGRIAAKLIKGTKKKSGKIPDVFFSKLLIIRCNAKQMAALKMTESPTAWVMMRRC